MMLLCSLTAWANFGVFTLLFCAGEKIKEDLVAAPTADGRVRHRVGLDEALVPRASLAPGPQPGKVMEVVRGRHEGLLAAVREVLDGTGNTQGVSGCSAFGALLKVYSDAGFGVGLGCGGGDGMCEQGLVKGTVCVSQRV